MREQKSGRVYRVPGTGATDYVASAPGEAPAVATGRLIDSINVFPDRGGRRLDVGVEDVSDVPYAVWLEFGTSRMRARPWLRPAVRKTNTKNRQTLLEVLRVVERQVSL